MLFPIQFLEESKSTNNSEKKELGEITSANYFGKISDSLFVDCYGYCGIFAPNVFLIRPL